MRFKDVISLIHYLEGEGIWVEKILSDTKVLAESGQVYSIRGEGL